MQEEYHDARRTTAYEPLSPSLAEMDSKPAEQPPLHIEALVTFLNVDLEVHGASDHPSLIRAFGDFVCVLSDASGILSFEVSDGPDGTLATKLESFVKLLSGMPPEARASWASASRRAINIGIQAGLGPQFSEWTVSSAMLCQLAAFSIELTMTVYGAEVRREA